MFSFQPQSIYLVIPNGIQGTMLTVGEWQTVNFSMWTNSGGTLAQGFITCSVSGNTIHWFLNSAINYSNYNSMGDKITSSSQLAEFQYNKSGTVTNYCAFG